MAQSWNILSVPACDVIIASYLQKLSQSPSSAPWPPPSETAVVPVEPLQRSWGSQGPHGEHVVIIFLKFLVISQSSTAENRTLCGFRLSRFPHCTRADGIALGLSVGDSVTVITSYLRESRPPSVCFMGDHVRDFPSCVGKWCHSICEPRGTLLWWCRAYTMRWKSSIQVLILVFLDMA